MREVVQNNLKSGNSVARKSAGPETQTSPSVTDGYCSEIRNQSAQFDDASDQHPAVVLTIKGIVRPRSIVIRRSLISKT